MAQDKTFKFKFIVDDSGAVTGLKSLQKGISDIDLKSKNAEGQIKKLTAEFKNLGSAANQTAVAHKNSEQAIIGEINRLTELSRTIDVNSAQYNKIRNQISEYQHTLAAARQGVQGVSSATGSATASTLEFGRVISDMPYGIRGVANNLSQLASNITFTATRIDEATGKAIGFGGALKAIGRSLLGPLGILLAIQSVIAIIEMFSQRAKEAEVSTDEWEESIKTLNNTLNDLYGTSDNAVEKIEEYIKITLEKKKVDDAVKKNSEKLEKIQEKINEREDYYNKIKKQRIDLESRGATNNERYQSALRSEDFYLNLLNESQKERNDLITETIRLIDDLKDREDEFKSAQEGTVRYYQDHITKLKKFQTELSKTSLEWNSYKNAIDETQKLIDAITGGKEEKLRKSKATYGDALFDLSKYILKLEEDQALATEENELKKFQLKQEYARKELKLQYDLFVAKEEMRLQDFLQSNATDKAKADAVVKSGEIIKKAGETYSQAFTQLTLTQATQETEFALNLIRKFNDLFTKASQLREISQMEKDKGLDVGVDGLEADNEIERQKYENKLYWINQEIEDRKRQGESFADLVARQTEIENTEQTRRLLFARKVQEAKNQVLLSGLDVVMQIAGEGSAVGKAAGVAMATISTYEAATAALGSKPYGPWNIAQAAIVTAAGLLNVKKILDTPIPSTSGKMSSGGAVNQGRTFDFNLVGSTGQNQLAQTIGGQIQQPIKAYVVSSEITNQQQFDNQIQGKATIGG